MKIVDFKESLLARVLEDAVDEDLLEDLPKQKASQISLSRQLKPLV